MDILLIDDELELRETLAETISDAGHSISEAGDGRTAAALIATKAFDVILCDVHLPDTNGLTLLRTIRREAPLTDFMLMTAFADLGDAIAALKEGATDYLTKPFDLDELLHHLARIDAARSMRRELGEARRALATRAPGSRIVGHSAQMLKVQARRRP
jgi:two-component system, NtrC family, response regulator AtoC